MNLLAVLEQNPGTQWTSLLGGIDVVADTGGAVDLKVEVEGDDELASFKL